jgi:hypothetical protein
VKPAPGGRRVSVPFSVCRPVPRGVMSELIDAVVSWPTLLIALGVFGFAPRAVLRLLLLAYPKDCPRRAELMAELKAVPRLDRPLWVAE